MLNFLSKLDPTPVWWHRNEPESRPSTLRTSRRLRLLYLPKRVNNPCTLSISFLSGFGFSSRSRRGYLVTRVGSVRNSIPKLQNGRSKFDAEDKHGGFEFRVDDVYFWECPCGYRMGTSPFKNNQRAGIPNFSVPLHRAGDWKLVKECDCGP